MSTPEVVLARIVSVEPSFNRSQVLLKLDEDRRRDNTVFKDTQMPHFRALGHRAVCWTELMEKDDDDPSELYHFICTPVGSGITTKGDESWLSFVFSSETEAANVADKARRTDGWLKMTFFS